MVKFFTVSIRQNLSVHCVTDKLILEKNKKNVCLAKVPTNRDACWYHNLFPDNFLCLINSTLRILTDRFGKFIKVTPWFFLLSRDEIKLNRSSEQLGHLAFKAIQHIEFEDVKKSCCFSCDPISFAWCPTIQQ